MKAKEPFVDVEKILKEKNPTLHRWLPSFVIQYVKRIVHEKEVNQIMLKNGQLHGLDFVNALIEEFGVHVELTGAENIPLEKPVIFASNHPLGGMDGIAFMHALGKYRKDIRFLVNDILTNITNFEPMFIPVNKHGANSREVSKLIEDTYAGNHAVLVFPAGLVSRKQHAGIKDLEWKKSFISKSKKYQKDVVPVYIEGKNSGFFYNLARLRKQIGIKANIEMFYLADEMFSQRGKKVVIHIGKPIPYQYFDASKNEKEWAEVVKETVYRIAKN
ncbi:1-acyl-sn-glycerol-3-phosphate acyltransferase [Belliella kenyensis]|uniref:1-acyl-sn-glycerol-3-phosphate acyltransferase n=1 Tax=Belliella kenyensis TaxID=1472724 RepID=A0ABV8EJG4_9BACT|nr:1-acyl-sn-glycerol-3-phosphate acyltransferase [Belliella kenyensis]MCH7400265.1 1-acyl-sn-glycerol-3-phosphate acyltransferase [Belliella kenyensis]MDN3604718.1 1-acyl-sn-glycerol-3-phosphate acyltransferase [Belliella kenyensis]